MARVVLPGYFLLLSFLIYLRFPRTYLDCSVSRFKQNFNSHVVYQKYYGVRVVKQYKDLYKA